MKIKSMNKSIVRFLLFFVFYAISPHVFSQTSGKLADFREVPRLKWEFSSGSPIYASPIVSGNSIYIGGLDSILHVLDIETGIEKWSFRTHGQIRSNVCPGNSGLYFNGGDGNFYALNAGNGALIWKFKTGNVVHTTAAISHLAFIWLSSNLEIRLNLQRL